MAKVWSYVKQFLLLKIDAGRSNNCLEDVPDEVAKSLIFSRLSLLDGIRLRSVSKSCRERIKGICPRPQLPWLMLPRQEVDICRKLSFFDMSRGAVHDYSLPSSFQGANFCGSSKGWLVFSKYTTSCLINIATRLLKIQPINYVLELGIFLFNPISNVIHQLPSLPVKGRIGGASRIPLQSQVLLVQLSSADITFEDCVIAALIVKHDDDDDDEHTRLVFCRPRDKQWTRYDRGSYVDILFWKETLCVLQATSNKEEVNNINIIHKSTFKFGGLDLNIIKIPCDMGQRGRIEVYFAGDDGDEGPPVINGNEVPDDDNDENDSDSDSDSVYSSDYRVGVVRNCIKDPYLVESSNGDLLIILKVSDVFVTAQEDPYMKSSDDDIYVYRKTRDFQVFKMDPNSGKFNIVDDIEDETIFLTLFGSVSCKSSDFEGVRGNCIYFVEDTKNVCYYGMIVLSSRDSGVYGLEDKKIERCFPSLDSNTEDLMCWFIPTL